MTAEEVEEIRRLIYKATYYAQRDGYVLGARTMTQIMCEASGTADYLVKE